MAELSILAPGSSVVQTLGPGQFLVPGGALFEVVASPTVVQIPSANVTLAVGTPAIATDQFRTITYAGSEPVPGTPTVRGVLRAAIPSAQSTLGTGAPQTIPQRFPPAPLSWPGGVLRAPPSGPILRAPVAPAIYRAVSSTGA